MVEAKVDFPSDFYDKVKQLMSSLGFGSEAEVIYYAVTLLSQIQEESSRGNLVQFEPKSGKISGSTSTFKI